MATAAMPNAQHAQPLGQPAITREMAQSAYEDFQRMKAMGVPESDPNLIRVKQILALVSRRKQMASQRAQYQQQQQHQQQQAQLQQRSMQQGQPQPNGQPINQNTNGIHSPIGNEVPGAGANGASSIPGPGQSQGGFIMTEEQRTLLRNQINAFKLLSRDMPLPPDVQRSIFSKKSESSPTLPPDAPTKFTPTAAKQGRPDPETEIEHPPPPRKGYETFKDPWAHKNPIGFLELSRRDRRLLVPSIMPTGVDVDRYRERREIIIYNNLLKRKEQLEKMPATWDTWDTTKAEEPTPDGAKKLKALIEYKSLCFLAKQRDLRARIAREMVEQNTLAMTANRAKFRRQKKQSIMAAKNTERLERQQREARVSKEKQKHDQELRMILDHAKEVRRAAIEQAARNQRIGRAMMDQHKIIEKEEQKRIERTAKQRLQALKANDEETYLKLLGQAKDSRITHLLKQTDNFLNQLATSVKTQQRSAGARDVESESEEEEEELEDDEDGGKKIDYYEVAHRIKEEVKEQSSNLVGGTLKEYQLKGLQWMISLYNNKLNGILADEMGLGKTIQTISLITYLIEKKKQPGPYLVIVPLSTLTNWNNEFDKWAPSVQKIVYKGPPNSRKQAQAQIRSGQFQVLLTTYEFIIKDRPILSKVKWVHMIVDEGHRMKNANSKLSSTITQYYSTRYRLILTGTPLQNNLPELWALLNFVLPNIFKSVKSFDEWFNTPFANTGGQDKMDLTEEEQLLVIKRLHKVLRPFLLRRLKKDVEKDLPDKQERVIKCNFSALQAKLYKSLMTTNKLMVSDGKGGKTGLRGLSNMLMQLRKLCNHPFVFEEVENQINPTQTSNDLLWRTAGKFELLDRVLPKFQATGHRVLMFFQMTQIMNIMEDFLRLRGIQYLRLDGSTKADERAELLKLYNAPNSPYFCFLLSTRAGGLGLNLQTADTVIIYDSDWNPHQDLQAQDRAHRIGQKNEVRILRLITSNSVEEKILERAQFKLDMDGKVIQAGKFDNKSTNEERDAMLRVMLESAEAVEEMEQEEMDDDDLNMMMMRSDEELVLFQKMDAERARDPKYGKNGTMTRLLSESELPDIYLQEDPPQEEETVEDLMMGRGARERTKVRYDDGLTEEQWLDAVDNDDDTIEEAIARKEAKVARRVANKERRSGAADGNDTPPPASRESTEEPQTQPKKRGRKPGSAAKRKADEASLDSEPLAAPAPAPKRRGRQPKSAPETLTPAEREATQAALDAVHDNLMDLEAEPLPGFTEKRQVIDPFLSLPPRADYPDYYAIIKTPICMENIGNKVNEKRYQSLDEFARDVKQLCDNARTYNEDGSLLYQDATLIETTAMDLLAKETAARPALGKAAFTGVGITGPAPLPDAPGTPALGTPTSGAGSGRIKLNLSNGASTTTTTTD